MTPESRALIPLYLATFVVLFCGISAVNSTVEVASLTLLSTFMLAGGLVSSFWMRQQGADQKVLVWVVCGAIALFILFQPSLTDWFRSWMLTVEPGGMSSSGIGVLLEWATILFSFTLLTNYSLLFSIVPSMALIGLMSSENLNPEMVTYFIGFVLSTVFLMGYQAHLERSPETVGVRSSAPLRPFIVLSAGVVMGAFLLGSVASAPLKLVGREVFSVAAQNIPSSPINLAPLNLGGADDQMTLSGRTPNLGTAEVMRVQSRVPMYWRGAVYDRYGGSSWQTTLPFPPMESGYPGLSETAERVFDLDPRQLLKNLQSREPLIQRVSLSRFEGAIYAAGEPRRVQGPMDRIMASENLSVRADWGRNNLVYTVTSWVSHASPEELRQAPPLGEEESLLYYPFSQRTANEGGGELAPHRYRYIRLPDRDPFPFYKLQRLAQNVTRNALTNYDKALAIEQYLRSSPFTYTLDPPLLPPDKDAAEFFLLDTHTGYCEQFANGMAVLLRTLSIPARVVSGYAPGEYDRQRGEWVVRELDAHAWVEVYFPTYGWITFDPTAGVQPARGGFSLQNVYAAVIRFLTSRQFLPSFVLLGIFTVMMYVLKTEAYDRYLRWWTEALLKRRRGEYDPRWGIERSYRQLRRTFRRWGVSAPESQTPREFQEEVLARWQEVPALQQPVRQMTDLYMEAAYSDHPVNRGAEQAAAVWLKQIRTVLKEQLKRKSPS